MSHEVDMLNIGVSITQSGVLNRVIQFRFPKVLQFFLIYINDLWCHPKFFYVCLQISRNKRRRIWHYFLEFFVQKLFQNSYGSGKVSWRMKSVANLFISQIWSVETKSTDYHRQMTFTTKILNQRKIERQKWVCGYLHW